MKRRRGQDSESDDALLVDIEQGLSRLVMRGSAWSSAGFALSRLITLGTYLVIARLLTPSEFGAVAAGAILVEAGMMLSGSGMLAALIHRRDRVAAAASTAVVATILGGMFFTGLALLASPLIGAFFGSGEIASLAAAMAPVIAIRATAVVPSALLQRRFSFLRRVVAEPGAAIAFGAGAIISALNGLGPWSLVVGYYAAAVTEVLLSWLLLRWRPTMSLVSFEMWRELVGYGRHVLASAFVLRGGDQVPTVLLGGFVNVAAIGQFRYAERIAVVALELMLSIVSYVLFPAFARIATDRDRFQAAFLRAVRWMSIVAMLAGAILIALGEPLAVALFGEQWREAGQAATILGGFVIFRAVANVFTEAWKAIGEPHLMTKLHIYEAIAGTAAMVALLPLGLLGVTAGLTIGSAVGLIYGFAASRSTNGLAIVEMLRPTIVPAAACVLTTGVVGALELGLVQAASSSGSTQILKVAGELALATVIYASALSIFDRGIPRDFIGLLRSGFGRTESVGPTSGQASEGNA